MTSFRRGSATKLSTAFEKDEARLLLAHNPGSTTLEKSYHLSLESRDILAGVLDGGGTAVIASRDQYSLMR
jgi:hypothetical protein